MRGEKQRTSYEGLEFIRSIVAEHLSPDWRVRVNKRFSSTLSMASYNLRLLEFSLPVLEYMSDFHLRQLALHEIAHALAQNDGHGKLFKKKCKEIGCFTSGTSFFWDCRYIFPDGLYPNERRRVEASKVPF